MERITKGMFTYRFIIFNILCVCTFIVLSSGCASQQKQKALNTFDERTRLYGRLLRWKEYEAAVNLIRHQDESPVNVDLGNYEDLRVVKYEIKRAIFAEDKKSAEVEAEISYYFETQNQVKTIRDTQSWWYLKEVENWFLDGSLPAF